VPYLAKIKHAIAAHIPHSNCQAWWLRGDFFGLVLQQQELELVIESITNSYMPKYSQVKCEFIYQIAKGLAESGSCNWTMVSNTLANLQLNA